VREGEIHDFRAFDFSFNVASERFDHLALLKNFGLEFAMSAL